MCKFIPLVWKLRFHVKVASFILFLTPCSYFLEDRNLRSVDADLQELHRFILNVSSYVAEDLTKHHWRMNEWAFESIPVCGSLLISI